MMEEKFNVLGSEAKIYDLVEMAAKELFENGLNVLDFDIRGMTPDGPIVLHFEVTIQKVGNS